MNIAQAQQEMQRLYALYQSNQITPEAYTLAVNGLQITDESGNFWHVDGATLQWYRYVDQAWVEQAPPALSVPPPPPPAPPAAAPWPPAPPPPPPDASYSAAPSRSRLPLLIGLGVGLLVIAAVVVLLLTGVFSGGSKAALPPTQTQAGGAIAQPAGITATKAATALPKATTAAPAATTATATPKPASPGLVTRTPSPTRAASATSAATATPKPTQPPAAIPLNLAKVLSPDGPWLLSYHTQVIFLIQADGVVGINTESVVAPSTLAEMIAPSGGRLAFITSSDPEGLRSLHLTIYNLAQRRVEKVINLTSAKTDPPAGAMPGDPSVEAVRAVVEQPSLAWSPDGRSLAFIGVIDGPSSDLYSYNLDTDKILHLTDGPSQAYAPSWSPDAKFITQFGVTGFGTGAGFTMAGAWAAHADDSGVVSLYTPDSHGETLLGWVDNNTFLVYGFNMMCGHYGLRAVSIQPVEVNVLYPSCFSDVAFDPVKHTLALAIDKVTSEGPGQMQAGLYLRKLDGTWQMLVSGDFPQVALPAYTGVVWGYNYNDNIAVAYTTAGAALSFPGGTGGPHDVPCPSPDGKTWALFNRYDQTGGLLLGPVSGGTTKVFTDRVASPAWKPDGSVLAFMSVDTLYFVQPPAYQPVQYTDIDIPTTTYLAWVNP